MVLVEHLASRASRSCEIPTAWRRSRTVRPVAVGSVDAMPGTQSPEVALTGMGGQSRPRPPLHLDTRLIAPPPYRDLTDDDPFYEIAAYAYLHQDALDDDAYAELFSALARIWPLRAGGRHVSTERSAMNAFILSQHRTLADVAAYMMCTERHARRLIDDGRRILVVEYFFGRRRWRVESDPGREHGPVYVMRTDPSPAERRV
jgi:hypothetical protein